MADIYKIENLITEKIYIGQSVEVEERISLSAFNAIWYN